MESSGFTSLVENIEQNDDEVEVGDGNFRMLSTMLKEQMALVHSQKELYREQAEEMQVVMQQVGKRMEQLGSRLDCLEQRVASECRQVSSLKEELNMSQRNQNNDSISISFEIKIGELEARLERLERAVELSSWTEDRMASVHAQLLATVYTDLKTELLEELNKKIVERTGEQKVIVSERRRANIGIGEDDADSWKVSSTPRGNPSRQLPVIGKRKSSLLDPTNTQQHRPVPRPRTVDGLGARSMLTETQQMRNQRPVQKCHTMVQYHGKPILPNLK